MKKKKRKKLINIQSRTGDRESKNYILLYIYTLKNYGELLLLPSGTRRDI